MTNIIAVDASTQRLSLCLKSGQHYFETTLDCGLKHSENLLDQIDSLVKTAGISINETELLICTAGPGSFTGLRIGMSTIKGIATALDIPYKSVPTLDVLAWGLDYFPGAVVPVIDAKKKRYYCAVYEQGNKVTPDMDVDEETLFETLKSHKKILLTGPDCMMINKEARDGLFRDQNHTAGRSRQLLDLGLELFMQNGPNGLMSGPVYIRKSEAEITRFGE